MRYEVAQKRDAEGIYYIVRDRYTGRMVPGSMRFTVEAAAEQAAKEAQSAYMLDKLGI